MAGEDATGTQLKRDSNGAGVFVTIASVEDLSGPSRTRNMIDVSAHDSPDNYREFVKGMKDGGEVTATINYQPGETTHQALDADFEEDELRDYQLVLLPGDADEHTWDFTAGISDISDEFPLDDKMAREVTFKISGKPTLTPTG
ncbi:phage tail tube protein [Streptomyces capitiformicae]|uniref:Phage capsid protein n=1 Tax=Streptomyces capitiformicae TaxID=2014920 RepID=A0A919GH39_9ACTN|nr:phage tail tube protein [Streptomyces capitiformicae]GHH83866.1 phage capsid protein [Streptomyces capitiformicae]